MVHFVFCGRLMPWIVTMPQGVTSGPSKLSQAGLYQTAVRIFQHFNGITNHTELVSA